MPRVAASTRKPSAPPVHSYARGMCEQPAVWMRHERACANLEPPVLQRAPESCFQAGGAALQDACLFVCE